MSKENITPRKTDRFRVKKGVHTKMHTSTHLEFRKLMFEKGLTMQWAFEEFARLAVEGDKRAVKIIDDLSVKMFKKEIEKEKYKAKKKSVEIDKFDHDKLYSLIEENDEAKGAA